MHKLIDSDKLLKWIEESPSASGFWGEGSQTIKALEAFDNLKDVIESGAFQITELEGVRIDVGLQGTMIEKNSDQGLDNSFYIRKSRNVHDVSDTAFLRNTSNRFLIDMLKSDPEVITHITEITDLFMKENISINAWGLFDIPISGCYCFINKADNQYVSFSNYMEEGRFVPTFINASSNEEKANSIKEAIERYLDSGF